MTFSRRATAFTRTIHARTTLTAAEHLAHFFHGLEVLLFGDAAVAICIHALEVFLGVTKHATSTATFTTWAHALTLRLAAGGSSERATFAARGTTEAAPLTAGGTTAFGTAHALSTLASLPWATTPTCLRHLGHFFFVDKTITVGVNVAKAVLASLLAHIDELILADLAVVVRISIFDEGSDAFRWIATARRATLGTTRRRTTGRATFRRRAFGCVLSAGEAGQAQDAEPVEECFFEFHSVREFG